MIKVRSAAVLIEEDRVLLVRHVRRGQNGHLGLSSVQTYWVFPGGEVRQGEDLRECARRETLEETGVEVDVGPLLFCGETIWPGGERHVVNFFFAARRLSGSPARPDWSPPDERGDYPAMVPLAECARLRVVPDILGLLQSSGRRDVMDRFLGNLYVETSDR